ncbi:MAG: class F sortase [Anaerolineae bacterium]|nr:class F sortase [Anaerolineae bacterium]
MVGTPTTTPRPTRTDVFELRAGVPTPTLAPLPEPVIPTPRFTLDPLQLNLETGEDAQPTARDLPPGGVYPIRIALEDLGILASVLVVQTDENFDIVTPREEVAYYALTSKIGGGGNTLMVGHVFPGRVFNNLLDAEVGQIIRVTDELYNEHYYQIEEIRTILYEEGTPEDRELGLAYMYDNSAERLTLVTCYPEYDWTHRFVVRAVPINPDSIGGR